MNTNEIAVLQARCQESRRQAEMIAQLSPDLPVYRVRFQFARAAGYLAAEHHLAIVTLCEAGLCGTATSLLRAVLEAGATVHWLLYAANSETVRDLHALPPGVFADKPDIPGLKVMLNELAARGPLPRVADIRDMLEPNGAGRWLHKAAHGGIAILKGRNPAGAYSLAQAQIALCVADMFALIAASVGTVIHPALELDNYIGARRDELARELVATHGAKESGDPWKSLPKCIIDDAWDSAGGQ
jgi:hypothetical protein